MFLAQLPPFFRLLTYSRSNVEQKSYRISVRHCVVRGSGLPPQLHGLYIAHYHTVLHFIELFHPTPSYYYKSRSVIPSAVEQHVGHATILRVHSGIHWLHVGVAVLKPLLGVRVTGECGVVPTGHGGAVMPCHGIEVI
jgi:hypothetical protein